MKFLEHQCPKCRRQLELPTYCRYCKSTLELKPDFLSTFPSKVLFFSGALLLGSSLSGILTAAGIYEFGIYRLIVDTGLGAGYYLASRFVFSFFQHPTVASSQSSNDFGSGH
jgi:hypothetical protein